MEEPEVEPEPPKPKRKPRKPKAAAAKREPRAPKAPEPEPASYLEVLKRGLDIARNKHKADKVARYDTFFAY